MSNAPIPPLAHLADDELASLAVSWRARAGYGEREAFGIAHAMEVEVRRRTRESYLQALQPATHPVRHPWWRLWATGARQGEPDSASPGP